MATQQVTIQVDPACSNNLNTKLFLGISCLNRISTLFYPSRPLTSPRPREYATGAPLPLPRPRLYVPKRRARIARCRMVTRTLLTPKLDSLLRWMKRPLLHRNFRACVWEQELCTTGSTTEERNGTTKLREGDVACANSG